MPDLDRFVTAQDKVWSDVTRELDAGRKTSHWMWFVFPQLAGLGASPTSAYFALGGLDAARAYLRHPILGPRLEDATARVLLHAGTPPEAIFGGIDARKFRSSMTLFEAADPARPIFAQALETFHGGRRCGRTRDLLAA